MTTDVEWGSFCSDEGKEHVVVCRDRFAAVQDARMMEQAAKEDDLGCHHSVVWRYLPDGDWYLGEPFSSVLP